MGEQSSINYEAWARNAVAFIREEGLEQKFKDWSGGFPCPVQPAQPDPVIEALNDALNMLRAAHMHCGVAHESNKRVIKARAILAKAREASK